MKKIYKSLSDGMAKREDYFDLAPDMKNAEVGSPFPDGEAAEHAAGSK